MRSSIEAIPAFYDQLLDGLESLPGVTAAGAVTALPLADAGGRAMGEVEEFPTPPGGSRPVFVIARATPGYFEAMGIPLVEGRTFTDADHGQRLGSVIVSRSIKDRFWPSSTALGKSIQTWLQTPQGPPRYHRGRGGDVHYGSLESAAPPVPYKPMLDSSGGGVASMRMVVRAQTDPLALVPAIRELVGNLDPDVPIADLRSMESIVRDSMSRTSFTMTMLLVAAAVALILGAVGIYGVISYIVARRTGEIGVRRALGADAASIRSLVLKQGMGMAVAGVIVGVAVSLMLGGVLSSLLYGVSPYDAMSVVGGSAVFLLVAALACLVPAARAAGISPVEALRR